MSNKLLNPEYLALDEIFKNVYNIPVYQRPYTWEKEQIDVLLNDLFKAFKKENSVEYYVGNIILYDAGEKINGNIVKYDVIDGQQRLISFSLIMLATYCLSSKLVDENDPTLLTIKGRLWKYFERQYHKDSRSIIINSIEKKCYEDIYDTCFTNPSNILDYCEKYSNIDSKIDDRLIKVFINIYNRLDKEIVKNSDLSILEFSEFLLNYVRLIAIESRMDKREVFNIFESINSKGKQLDTIDLIKSYIFSKLDETNYNTYSIKWGNLIKNTEDHLYDYLYTYIRAYIRYYETNINITNFKVLSCNDLLNKYNVDSEKDALVKLIDDLEEKVKYYQMICDEEKAYSLIKSNEVRYYLKVFIKNEYQHPKPLLFRILAEFDAKKIQKKNVEAIVSEVVTFMLKYKTICELDSKTVISAFKTIMTKIIDGGTISKKDIINVLEGRLSDKNISSKTLKVKLNDMIDCYKTKRKLAFTILSLYQSAYETKKGSGEYRVSYDEAYTLMSRYENTESLDHILNQTPKSDDPNLKYYEENKKLCLKSGNDFPKKIVFSGMSYSDFTTKILDRLGNLRIMYKDMNSQRRNLSDKDFCTFASINNRVKEIGEIVFDKILVDKDFEDVDMIQCETDEDDLEE